MCRETIVYHVNSINYLYAPLYVAPVFVVHYVMKIYFAGWELYLYASLAWMVRLMDADETAWMAVLLHVTIWKAGMNGKYEMTYLDTRQLATELCLHFALIAQEICFPKEQVDSENTWETALFLFSFLSLERQKMHTKINKPVICFSRLPCQLRLHYWSSSHWKHNIGNSVQVTEVPKRNKGQAFRLD